jgi:inner membrane transporter RhtA
MQINRVMLTAVGSVLLAMVTIQSGASLAKQLFPLVGPEGTTALRLGFAAVVLWLVFRPWQALPQGRDWQSIITYGLCLGGMNILFYLAIERIPLGIAVALEFTGPLALALFGSKRKSDLLWVAIAIAGILLLLPDLASAQGLDLIGALMALGAGACWAHRQTTIRWHYSGPRHDCGCHSACANWRSKPRLSVNHLGSFTPWVIGGGVIKCLALLLGNGSP